MPTRQTHLHRRGAIYYWRARLPARLSAALRQTHLVKSLRTPVPGLARRRARAVSAAMDRLEEFLMNAPARFSPTRLQMRLVLESLFNRILEEGTAKRDAEPHGLARYAEGDPVEEPIVLSSENREEWTADDWDAYIAGLQADAEHPENKAIKWGGLAEGNITDDVKPLLDEELKAFGVSLTHDDPQYDVLARDANRVIARAYAIEAERWRGHHDSAQGIPSFVSQKYPDDSPLIDPWSKKLGREEADFLSQYVRTIGEEFIELRQANGAAMKTERDDRIALRYFLDLVGDIRINDLMPNHSKKLAEQLLRMPREYGRGIYARKTPRQAIKIADRLEDAINESSEQESILFEGFEFSRIEAQKKAERMRKKTANKHLSFFTSLWRSSLVPRSLQPMNPFAGALYKKRLLRTETARRGTRTRYSQEQLLELFATPIWQGCASKAVRTKPGNLIIDDWRYWAPLIALYTGMRREEVARLRTSDFDEVEGIWLVRIQATDGRHLKSEAANREIPIHSQLIELGFREYVERRGKRAALFPDLRPTGASKEYGEQVGRWFRYYRQSLGIYYPQTDFHSFRHTFVQWLRNSGVPSDLIAVVVGHEDERVTSYVYGKDVSIQQKQQVVERLSLKTGPIKRPLSRREA